MSKNTKLILFLILVMALFLRIYNFRSYYVFSHDQDLASWIIKDILVNKHLRLIGQETSSQGVFIGALFYYLQIPFYLIGNMNPTPSVFLPVILGVFATYSMYFVVSKIFNTKIGLTSAFIYATSSLIVFIDREVVPTMPVMLWTIWYLYSLFLVYKNKQFKGFLLWGLLLGLVWHLNMALYILSPLIVVPLWFSKNKPKFKAIILGIGVSIFLNVPFLIFEYRHDFIQIKSVVASLITDKDYTEGTARGFSKLDRVMQLVYKNSMSIISREYFVHPKYAFWGLVILFIYLFKNKMISKFIAIVFALWQVLYITFFSVNSLNVSEYYFNGMNIIWIIIMSVVLAEAVKNKYKNYIIFTFLSLFLIKNISTTLRYNTDKKGYVEKIALVSEIKNDSNKHGYPCISVSYITSPGYDFGYRYLFWLEDMHVNKPISGSPVYSIVFPLRMVDGVDQTYGSLGLIYPDYEQYNEEEVGISCMGENSNLTDPMFGFTQ